MKIVNKILVGLWLTFGAMAHAITLNTGIAGLASETTLATPVTAAPQKTWRSGFDYAVASGPDTNYFTTIQTGSGMAVSQSGGNLIITSGTTAYSETILRSVPNWSGNNTIRYSTNLSQRIANQEFYVEYCDVIGDGLSYTINSATSVTVTIPGTTFTSANVGQSMYLGAMSVASCPTGRYAIASVSGTAVTFTVAGFPASGSGTLSLFGWNYYHMLYSGVTATNAGYDCSRNGWNSGDTTLTINTTASPGHSVTLSQRNASASVSDQLSASSIVQENTMRGSRIRNIVEDLTVMRIQIRVANLSSAPATTTTWTIGVVEVDNFVTQQFTMVGMEPFGFQWPMPVQFPSTPNFNIFQINGVTPLMGNGVTGTGSPRVTIASDNTAFTVNLGTGGTAATSLSKAEDAPATSGDTGVFAMGVRRDAPVVSASANGDYQEIAINKWGGVLEGRYEGTAKTYGASTAALVPAASATDIFTITGNATTTVYVTKITISGTQTTGGQVRFDLVKRSTADTAGTSTAPTAVPYDSGDAAASAVLAAYTANPTTGTTVGAIRSALLSIGATTNGSNEVQVFDFGATNGKPVVLSGTAQALAVNLAGVTVTGGSFYISIEWYEI